MAERSRPELPPFRRSELSTPGHDLRMLQKAAATPADMVIMDLEDGCAPDQKIGARATIVEAARTLDWGEKAVAFRPNGLATPYFLDDLREVVGAAAGQLDAVVLPKVTSPEDVRHVDRLLRTLERRAGAPEGRLRIEVLIETARGVLHAEEIARASPRVAALLFGIFDYAGEVGADVREDTFLPVLFAKQATVASARAAEVLVLDGITPQFRDLEITRKEALASRRMGFDGKWVIHPGQIDVVHQVFTPAPAELQAAEHRLQLYREAHRSGKGAIDLGGEMVDEATLRADARKVALGRRLGRLGPEGGRPRS